eukprot:GHVL01027183.1.p1 GENE.GHVL01027183.1~~GHVL01027183.1.p1  ORF type:complete len:244 (-),score=33.39 GHVL01027183.1:61-792(-)
MISSMRGLINTGSRSIRPYMKTYTNMYMRTYTKMCDVRDLQDYIVPCTVNQSVYDFNADAVLDDGSIKKIQLSDYKGQNVYLFFYPYDFTFVCPTEILAFNEVVDEFKARNTQLLGVSVDSVFCHSAWRNTPVNQGGIGPIKFPLISDGDKSISAHFGILIDNAKSLRGSFLIDKTGVIRHATINDLPLGRSTAEALRMIDALSHFEKNGEVCPANFAKSREAMKATKEGVSSYLAKHFDSKK